MSNSFILMQNAEKGLHELAHAGCYVVFGRERRVREFDDPQAKAGTDGPKYVALVHDIEYGYKDKLKFWVRWESEWIPIHGLNVRKYLN